MVGVASVRPHLGCRPSYEELLSPMSLQVRLSDPDVGVHHVREVQRRGGAVVILLFLSDHLLLGHGSPGVLVERVS